VAETASWAFWDDLVKTRGDCNARQLNFALFASSREILVQGGNRVSREGREVREGGVATLLNFALSRMRMASRLTPSK